MKKGSMALGVLRWSIHFVCAGIPTVYIILSLIDKPNSYNAPKYKCFDEKTAKKVSAETCPAMGGLPV